MGAKTRTVRDQRAWKKQSETQTLASDSDSHLSTEDVEPKGFDKKLAMEQVLGAAMKEEMGFLVLAKAMQHQHDAGRENQQEGLIEGR